MPALVQASAQFGAFRQQATLRPTRRGRAAVLRCTQAYLKQHQLEALQRTAEKWASGINNRDPDALCCTLSEKVVWSDRVWRRDDLVGRKRVYKAHVDLFQAYPDYRLHTEEVLARDNANSVAVHWTATATNAGEWHGHPASGRRSTFSGVSLLIFDAERDDQIREVICYRQPTAEERAHYMRPAEDQ